LDFLNLSKSIFSPPVFSSHVSTIALRLHPTYHGKRPVNFRISSNKVNIRYKMHVWRFWVPSHFNVTGQLLEIGYTYRRNLLFVSHTSISIYQFIVYKRSSYIIELFLVVEHNFYPTIIFGNFIHQVLGSYTCYFIHQIRHTGISCNSIQQTLEVHG
jgi:hypothetical protein